MKNKIDLLIDETGCDRAQAELALEMCGYDVLRAVHEIPNLLKDLVVVKSKLRASGPRYGLLLTIVNLKRRKLLRARAVVSFNPAVWMAPLDGDWTEFEKYLYACRLWEGSLQDLSQEVERAVASYIRSPESEPLFRELRSGAPGEGAAREKLAALAAGPLQEPPELQVKAEVLSLAQYQAMPRDTSSDSPREAAGPSGLSLRVALEGDPEGTAAGELGPGDLVFAQIIDPRDIAQYLAKLFGGRSKEGLLPLMVPVEGVSGSREDRSLLHVRVRFAVGVLGEVQVPSEIKVRVHRQPVAEPWWRKWFR